MFGAAPSGLHGGREAALSNGKVYPGASHGDVGTALPGFVEFEPGFLGLPGNLKLSPFLLNLSRESLCVSIKKSCCCQAGGARL